MRHISLKTYTYMGILLKWILKIKWCESVALNCVCVAVDKIQLLHFRAR
jgi:hypothetical protein